MDTALFVANTAGDHRSPLRYDANGVACQGCCALRDIRYVLTHGGRAWKPAPTNICETAGQRSVLWDAPRNVGNGLRPFRVLTRHGGRAWKPAPTNICETRVRECFAMGCARNVGNGLRPFRVLTRHGGRPQVAPTVRCRGDERSECFFKTV